MQACSGLSLLVAGPFLLFVEKYPCLHLEFLKGHYGSENAVWAWCQGLVFHSSDRLTDELWEAGERLSLRVPLLWRHSWAEQDLLQTTTRETESIWFNRCPSRQAPEELAANPAMLEASSAAQPISDITVFYRLPMLMWSREGITTPNQCFTWRQFNTLDTRSSGILLEYLSK